MELVNGSKLSTDAKSTAQLMLDSGAIIKVASNQAYVVGEKSAKAKQTGFVQGVQIAFNEVKTGGKNPTAAGMVKMGRPATGKDKTVVSSGLFGVQGLYPVHTSIRKPAKDFTFSWTKDSKINWEKPLLVVENSKKEQIFVQEIEPKQGSFEICPCTMGLNPGEKYAWYFAQKSEGKVSPKSSRYKFEILSEKEEKALNADIKMVEKLPLETDYAKKLLLAQVYYKYGMVSEMTTTLEPLYTEEQKKTDEKNLVRDLLYLGNARMGFAKQAEQYH